MSLLLKNALLVEPDLKKVVEGNLVIRNGLIDRKDFAADNEIDCTGKFVAPGIVDLGVKVCEPGDSHKESYESAGKAAAAGRLYCKRFSHRSFNKRQKRSRNM